MGTDKFKRNFIIGSAGHVDHGKTAVIRALSGIDADRLAEEKERGMTIDLGFAYIDIPSVGRVGIVDVPGHEKFVRNMLSGASGMDIAMIVIDINEGVMPQTLEHLEILGILGIKKTILVLNKTDLITDEDLISLHEEEIRNELKETVAKDAPCVSVSAKTGAGIDTLKDLIADMIEKKADYAENSDELFMPIDRAFSLKGIGTVVTGTIGSGTVEQGREYILYPEERRVTARSVQVHGEALETAVTGQRCAVNVSDVSKDNLQRGHFLATPEAFVPTMMLDTKLRILPDAPYGIANNSLIYFYYGTGQYQAKAVLMDRDYLEPGSECYVQFRFKEKLIARINDRYVIRMMSPQITLGGGTILDANPVKKRRNKEYVIDGFSVKEFGRPEDKAYQFILEHNNSFLKISDLNSAKIDSSAIDKLLAEEKIVMLGEKKVITASLESALKNYLGGILRAYHMKNPSYPGMPKAEVIQKLLGENRISDGRDILECFKKENYIKEEQGLVSLYLFKHEPVTDEAETAEKLIRIYQDAFMNPPAYNDMKVGFIGTPVFLPVLRRLIKNKTLVKLDERYYIHEDALKFAYERLQKMVSHVENGAVSLGDYRDRIKSSRKVALAVLEYFDRIGITRKEGNCRYLCSEMKEPR